MNPLVGAFFVLLIGASLGFGLISFVDFLFKLNERVRRLEKYQSDPGYGRTK